MPPSSGTTFNWLIEGWRGVNHSFALVNQHQILELLRLDGVRLFHRDLPFAFSHWNKATHDSGFSAGDQARIEALADPDAAPVDCIYRIVSPYVPTAPVAGGQGPRTLSFITTETGLSASSFGAGAGDPAAFVRDRDAIVTTTGWTRDRLVEYGFPAGKVHVVPCGVDTGLFRPLDPDERRVNRCNLGIADDETVFLNIGAAIWNKGVDVLLRAFAILRGRGLRVRLILKDQRDVYGLSVETTLGMVAAEYPILLQAGTLATISIISTNMERRQLRLLHGVADGYVSPYRAEGFNLPVIEALACAVPVIVTHGGATDEFCDDRMGWRIPGRAGSLDAAGEVPGRFIEPDLDALVAAMEAVVSGRRPADFDVARLEMLERFTWRRAAGRLMELAGDAGQREAVRTGPPAAAPGAAPAVVRPPNQADMLDLLRSMRPRKMRQTAKVRIGNAYDGGYVLPATAYACDAVLSIGVGSDVSFDLALAMQGATILQFDHTVEGPPVPHPNFRFEKRGWGPSTGGDLLGFADMLARLANIGARRPLLKFDVEGAEYEALDAIDAADLAGFEVIVCEIHHLGRLAEAGFFGQVRRSLAKLLAHHVPVHLHANNYAGMVLVEGIALPDVLEISFLRRDLDGFDDLAEPIPGPLDRPNHPLVADLCLTAFAA